MDKNACGVTSLTSVLFLEPKKERTDSQKLFSDDYLCILSLSPLTSHNNKQEVQEHSQWDSVSQCQMGSQGHQPGVTESVGLLWVT